MIAEKNRERVKNSKIQTKVYRIAVLLPENKWRRKWQPTPIFWPGESHGQRSLAGCSPWDHKSWT